MINNVLFNLEKTLYLGNIYAIRDWGHAKDYVEMQWKILQTKNPDDYIIATGKTYTVKQFIETAGNYLGYKIFWSGKGIDEVGYFFNNKKKEIIIKVDKKYFRPNEVNYLRGNPKKAYKELKFKTKYNNIVFIAIATNTLKSKDLTPSISITTEIDELIKAQKAANDAYNEINDKYIIPSLNSYNQIAKDANMKQYEITDNLSFIQINAEIAYEKSLKSEKSLISSASANYKTAIDEEQEKIILFYNAIKDLQTAFYNYCHLLLNPEISYKSSFDNVHKNNNDNNDNNNNNDNKNNNDNNDNKNNNDNNDNKNNNDNNDDEDDDDNNNDHYYCKKYETLNNDLYKALPEVNNINDEISKLKEKSMKTIEYEKIEETKNNVKLIFDYLEKSYLIKLDDYKNKIIKNTDDFLNKYIDLNTANNLYYNYIILYNQTSEKQEYNKKVIDTLPTIKKYDNIKNNIKRCYPDG